MQAWRQGLALSALLLVIGCGEDSVATVSQDTGGATGGSDTAGGDTGQSTGSGDATSGTDTAADSGGTDGADASDSTCTPGESFCNGAFVFTCNEAGTGHTQTECPEGCEGGACIQPCEPGGAVCDGAVLVECTEDGETIKTPCDGGCEDAACVDVGPVCTPDEVLCEPGSKKLLKCAADGQSATTLQSCPFGCEADSSECSEPACEPGETRCAPDDPDYVEVCKSDQSGWKKAESPCKQQCKDGACFVPECLPGETRCGPAGIEECNGEGTAFETMELCKSGCLSNGGDPVCAKCVEGLRQCKGDEVEECQDSSVGFVSIEQCTELQACVNGGCVDVVVLDSSVTKAANYLLLMKAFVDCFVPAVDGSCRAIDTQGISYGITKDDVKTWFCENKDDASFKSEFGPEANYLAAVDIVGACSTFDGFNLGDMTFEAGITANKSGAECIGFSSGGLFSANNKEVVVDLCTNFQE